MSQVLLSVRPTTGGWTVESSEGVEPMMFLSGGLAERCARTLAQTLARAGARVRLVIRDRALRVVGMTEFEPA